MKDLSKMELTNRLYYLVLVFVVGLLAFWGFRIYEIYSTVNGNFAHEITVEGKGKAYVVPDVAKIQVGVNTEAATSEETVQKNTEKINAVMAAINALGVEKKDIKTTGYSLSPKYTWTENESKQDGFTLNQNIEVKLHDFSKVGELIAATTKAGANMVGGVEFIIDDTDTVNAEAREEAVGKAMAKAKIIEKATGLKLGKVTNYYEYVDNGYMPYYDKAIGMGGVGAVPEAAVAPSIEPGQQEVNLTVSITFKIN